MFDNIFISLPTLKTKRLVLRKLLYSDQEDIFNYAKNPKVAKHVLWEAHSSEFDTIQFLNLVYDAYNHNKAAPWGIQLKEVGFVNYDQEILEAEIGYALAEEYWNKGIISEAVMEVLKFGFEKMNLKRIISRCKSANIASYRVLEKCGFKYDGIIEQQMLIKGKHEDMRMYSMSAKIYFKGKKQ